MAYIQPDGVLQILNNVPLDPDYENTLYFDTVEQQEAYFADKVVHQFTAQSYTRKERGWLKVGWSGDTYAPIIRYLYNSSYMRYKNSAFENKWFYAFVDRVNYINNNTVEVQFHIDVMQTWHFDYVFNQCLIDRQHTETDVFGDNTIPEQLEHGEYLTGDATFTDLISGTVDGPDFNYQPGIMLTTSVTSWNAITGEPIYEPGDVVNGLNPPWGSYFTGLKQLVYTLSQNDIAALNGTLELITKQAASDAVLSISMVPRTFIDADGSALGAKMLSLTRGNAVGAYVPRNNKLLGYPYNILYVTNNQGNSGEYHWENFNNRNTAEFTVWANPSPNTAMICYPMSYKGSYRNTDEKLTLTGFPLCAWTVDAFRAWFAQNAGTIVAGGAAIVGKWASIALAPHGTAAALASGAMDASGYIGQHTGFEYNQPKPSMGLIGATLGAVGQVYDHLRQPPQSHGDNNPSLLYQSGLLTFSFYRKYIKPEYAKIIDSYFDMYGYKINKVGTPNRNARRCYTYVKTIGCSLEGSLPSDDKVAIQAIFDKGIRFWRSSSTFGNFDPTVNDNSV